MVCFNNKDLHNIINVIKMLFLYLCLEMINICKLINLKWPVVKHFGGLFPIAADELVLAFYLLPL